jgi:glycosyltransferase involved in cell wall biosynthesis
MIVQLKVMQMFLLDEILIKIKNHSDQMLGNSNDDPAFRNLSAEVYIVLPAYNESKVIGNVIEELKERNWNIIVVDDGSSDETYKIANDLLENYKGFIYRHSINRGVGAALKTGIEAALQKNADLIVTFDADGQHDPDDINSLLVPIIKGDADIVNGYRNFEEMPLSKKLGNQIMNIITWIFYGVRVKDSQTGFKAFDRKAAQVFEIHSRGFGVISEIMGEVKRHDLKLKEVPIKTIYTDYSMAKGTNLKVGLKILFKLIMNLFRRVLS